MALFEKDGVRYELNDENHIAAFQNSGYVEVKDAAEVEEASAVSSSPDTSEKKENTKRRRRTQNKR